jgi:hypothetical protein
VVCISTAEMIPRPVFRAPPEHSAGGTFQLSFCYRFLAVLPDRCSMKSSILSALLLSIFAIAQQSAPQIRYRSVPNFLKLPSDIYLGEVEGVAVNSQNHVFGLSRGNSTGTAYGASSTVA